MDILGNRGKQISKVETPWKWVLAPLYPTPHTVRRTISMPGWLYDRFFFRSLVSGVRLDDVIVLELTKSRLPDPDRGETRKWQVSNSEEYPWPVKS